MPSPPSWFQCVDDALQALREYPSPVLDRAGIETLLRVSRRTAIRLLHAFGGYQAGRTFLISREDLIAALVSVRSSGSFQQEGRRRRRLEDDLDETRRSLRARQVKLPVPVNPRSGPSLPSGLRIVRPGVLEVDFASAEELLGRLYELVTMAGEDLEGFERLVADPETGI
jgi:hypothetical protein